MTQDNTDEDRPDSAEAPERVARQARAGAFLGVPIEVTISVGKARPLVEPVKRKPGDSCDPQARLHRADVIERRR